MEWLASIIVGLISAIGSGFISKNTNATNVALAQQTNAQNAQNVAAANAAQAAESEKARAYDSASSQVSRLQAAGMSKAGALGAISGAGTYTPAAVNVAQAQAPQIDSSGIMNALQGFMNNTSSALQQKESTRQFNETHDLDREKFELESSKVKLENIAKDIENTENKETRDNFPALRDFLNSVKFNLSTKSSYLDYDTQELWKDLKSSNPNLHDITSRNELLRDYMDNFIGYKFEDYMSQIGFTTTYKQAEMLRQKYSEFMSVGAIKTRADQAKVDELMAAYERQRIELNPNEETNIIKDFRKWIRSVFGAQAGKEFLDSAIEIAAWKFDRRKSGRR